MNIDIRTLDNADYFRLHTDVSLVQADDKDVIYDVGKSHIFPIHKEIRKLLEDDLLDKPVKTVLSEYESDQDVIVKYLDYLLTSNLGHITKSLDNHPKQDTVYYSFQKYRDGVIYYDRSRDYGMIVDELIRVGVEAFIIILPEDQILDYSLIDALTTLFEGKFVTYIEVVASHYSVEIESVLSYCKLTTFFFSIYNQSDILLASIQEQSPAYQYRVGMSNKPFDPYGKQIYDVQQFYIFNERFIEAHHHNIGTHKMVAIDYDGSIKNYLSHQAVHGNAFTDDLTAIISSDAFQVQWKYKNDMIEKCKTCQYRYCCSSTTEVIEDNGKYYKRDYCSF